MHPEKGAVAEAQDTVDDFTKETTKLMTPAIGFSKTGKWEKKRHPAVPLDTRRPLEGRHTTRPVHPIHAQEETGLQDHTSG